MGVKKNVKRDVAKKSYQYADRFSLTNSLIPANDVQVYIAQAYRAGWRAAMLVRK